MIYHIEFIKWTSGQAEPDVVERLSGDFQKEEDAFACAAPLMTEASRKGATAFRIFEDGETPEAFRPIADWTTSCDTKTKD